MVKYSHDALFHNAKYLIALFSPITWNQNLTDITTTMPADFPGGLQQIIW